ncbi:hypothetical protein ACHHYP_20627 [Achlya hypogyna]|uniref:Myb-like DNA-binding protein n=1 Tax=Achlya hypogyna TaxID=1202772 RepID=A0A1V9ZGR0_ACHHY|nr:hypothetical protein ACHHYP_20627 [Achlya hypogyna]
MPFIGLPTHSKHTKRKWDVGEDDQLIELVQASGACKWKQLATNFMHRSGKQCRERWYNQLNPAINHTKWTHTEDLLIASLQKELGNKWTAMAHYFTGRAIKNRWYTYVKVAVMHLTELAVLTYSGEASYRGTS